MDVSESKTLKVWCVKRVWDLRALLRCLNVSHCSSFDFTKELYHIHFDPITFSLYANLQPTMSTSQMFSEPLRGEAAQWCSGSYNVLSLFLFSRYTNA